MENFGTAKDFKHDPLVCIDPTDMNRNVGAALRIERFVDFIVASRNFLDIFDDDKLDEDSRNEKIIEFFNPLQKEHWFSSSLFLKCLLMLFIHSCLKLSLPFVKR